MQRYAAVAGLRPGGSSSRYPFCHPPCPGHWVGLVTPMPGGDRPAADRVGWLWWSPRTTSSWSTSPTAEGRVRLRRGVRLALKRVRSSSVAHPLGGVAWPGAPATDAERPGLGRRHALHRRAVVAVEAAGGRLWRGDRGHRREERLVLVVPRLGAPGWLDQLVGGVGPAPGTPRLGTGAWWGRRWTSGGSRTRAREAVAVAAEMRLPGARLARTVVEPARATGTAATGSGRCSTRAAARAALLVVASHRSTASSSAACQRNIGARRRAVMAGWCHEP